MLQIHLYSFLLSQSQILGSLQDKYLIKCDSESRGTSEKVEVDISPSPKVNYVEPSKIVATTDEAVALV